MECRQQILKIALGSLSSLAYNLENYLKQKLAKHFSVKGHIVFQALQTVLSLLQLLNLTIIAWKQL